MIRCNDTRYTLGVGYTCSGCTVCVGALGCPGTINGLGGSDPADLVLTTAGGGRGVKQIPVRGPQAESRVSQRVRAVMGGTAGQVGGGIGGAGRDGVQRCWDFCGLELVSRHAWLPQTEG